MAGWGGFSEEDLHRLKKDHLKSDQPKNQELEEKPENIRKSNINAGPKRQKPREKIKTKATASKKEVNGKQEMALQKTSCEAATEASELPKVNLTPEDEPSEAREKKTMENKSVEADNGVNCQEEKVPDIIVEPERIQQIELTALEKMQQKQKEIEDQNKKKKAALQETIRTRFRKTQAEANTLKYVHKELAHLDNLLSADVAVLRDTIEDATRDYHYAMKRYEHAEAEFVCAKMDLHRKTERKEMLTEHLLAVIQQNEERKAKKLEELMAKLEVSEELLEESLKDDHKEIVNTGDESRTNGNEMEEEKIEVNKKKEIPEKTEKGDGLSEVTDNVSNSGDENKTNGDEMEEEKIEVNGKKQIPEETEKAGGLSKVTDNESKEKHDQTQVNKNDKKDKAGQNEKVVEVGAQVVASNVATA